MELDINKPNPIKTDEKAPDMLEIIITNKATGEIFLKDVALFKHFSTGSVGYFCGGKLVNPESGERYQMSCSISLIGSKPK